MCRIWFLRPRILFIVIGITAPCYSMDHAQQKKWTNPYQRAAEQGDIKALSNLGIMYKKGEGVPQDYVQAYMWLNIAALLGDEKAAEVRDHMAAVLMFPEQIAEAERLTKEWLAKHPQ